MLKTLALSAALALGFGGAATASGGGGHVEDYAFPFEGPFGSYDTNQLQRGLKIYTEVCSACHGMRYVSFRSLSDKGGPELPSDQMRAYAEQFEVFDPSLNDGEGDFRAARPTDKFPEVTSAGAPDLSLMAKARAGFHGPYGTGLAQIVKGMGGPEYIASLLAGYEENPACAPDGIDGYYYNTVFAAGGYPDSCKDEHGHHTVPGSWIAMSPPLSGEDVDFDDGHSNSLHHEVQDVSAFLMWAAEPKLNARKQAGLTGVIFLTVLAALLYATNKRLWYPVKHGRKMDD